MREPATAGEFYATIQSKDLGKRALSARQRLVIRTFFSETRTEDLVRLHLDGVYTMRTLVEAMHAARGAYGHGRFRTRAINLRCTPQWRNERARNDPGWKMKEGPECLR